jgi:hypothetical protein
VPGGLLGGTPTNSEKCFQHAFARRVDKPDALFEGAQPNGHKSSFFVSRPRFKAFSPRLNHDLFDSPQRFIDQRHKYFLGRICQHLDRMWAAVPG